MPAARLLAQWIKWQLIEPERCIGPSLCLYLTAMANYCCNKEHSKYHSGGLWTNTCCSHPRLGEMNLDAAHRRLKEEMGMDCELTELFQFTYRHEFENGLIEHEYDHVFMGISDQAPEINPSEVAGFKYMDTDLLISELIQCPDKYTVWLKICLDKVLEKYYQINLI
jgi:isopentenyl-diphosphate delta-isomerase